MCKSCLAGSRQGQAEESSKSKKTFLATAYHLFILADLCTGFILAWHNSLWSILYHAYRVDQAMSSKTETFMFACSPTPRLGRIDKSDRHAQTSLVIGICHLPTFGRKLCFKARAGSMNGAQEGKLVFRFFQLPHNLEKANFQKTFLSILDESFRDIT